MRHGQSDELAMARLLTWVDGIDLPMFVLRTLDNDRLEFVHSNAALGRVTGLTPSVLAGRTAAEVFPARAAARLEGNYRQCLNQTEPVSYEECLLLDGVDTWWETTLSKPAGFSGQVILGVAIAITDRKNREFASAEAMAELTAQFDELRLFSTMAAHDARSPLATVSSLIDLVLDQFEDMGDGKTELLRLCSQTVDEALTQITSTLERGRSMQQGSRPETDIDLGRLCADIAAMVDPEMNMDITIPDLHVHCDEVVVQMGIRNLMSNAARYCRSRISVEASEDRQRGQLIIDVADDGPGLPEGMTLAELTRRGHKRDGSHGFGLASIAQLLGSRGGTFEVVHDVAHAELPGARFRMILPGRIGGDEQSGPSHAPERARKLA